MMPAWIGGHQRVDVGFDQRARVELLVAQALIELFLFGFDQLARGVVGSDQQIADDGVLRIAQRRDGHHRREAASVLPDIGQFIDVLDSARGLEDQGLEARRDRGRELDAQRLGARDQFLRIGNVGRCDLVHHFGGRVAQHSLGADIEDLNDALRVRGDAREVGAVENRALQGARLQQHFFCLPARGHVANALGGTDPRPRRALSLSHNVHSALPYTDPCVRQRTDLAAYACLNTFRALTLLFLGEISWRAWATRRSRKCISAAVHFY